LRRFFNWLRFRSDWSFRLWYRFWLDLRGWFTWNWFLYRWSFWLWRRVSR
jgi:hypothetical protein